MNAIYAGLMAWAIEISLVILFLSIIKFEENRVIKRRKKGR
jgi:hypothetical protein